MVTSYKRVGDNTVKAVDLLHCHGPLVITAVVGDVAHAEYELNILLVLVVDNPIVKESELFGICTVGDVLCITNRHEGVGVVLSCHGGLIIRPEVGDRTGVGGLELAVYEGENAVAVVTEGVCALGGSF